MDRPMIYNVVTLKDREIVDEDGKLTTLPAGSVINRIIWDGDDPYTPEEGTALVKADDE